MSHRKLREDFLLMLNKGKTLEDILKNSVFEDYAAGRISVTAVYQQLRDQAE